jgi:hypothetical protein
MKKNTTTMQSETDWERIDSMKDEDIDFSDSPRLTDEFFAKSIIWKGLKPVRRKDQITLESTARLSIISKLKAPAIRR